MKPSYLEAHNTGRLGKISEQAFAYLESCNICPRQCRVNRINGQLGYCKIAVMPKVYSFMSHHGEEPPISAKFGSGAIFFSHCNMSCAYCQNYEFSQMGEGREVDFSGVADMMLQLQDAGAHNINLVTPTHIMPQILKSLGIAISKGLNIPLVYNTGGYELSEMIKLLEGIVDIYLPDIRYGDIDAAKKYSDAPDYPEYNRKAVKEMHRQAGIAKINKDGIIEKGLIVRHLVLPEGISGTEEVMKFIAEEISTDTYISLMSQYAPYHKAAQFRELSRRVYYSEYQGAKAVMERYNLHNGWVQESGGLERFAGVNIKPA